MPNACDYQQTETHSLGHFPVNEWGTVNEVLKLKLLGRTTLYSLLRSGRIKSRLLKSNKYAMSGKRLIYLPSLFELIENSDSGNLKPSSEIEPEVSRS